MYILFMYVCVCVGKELNEKNKKSRKKEYNKGKKSKNKKLGKGMYMIICVYGTWLVYV